MERLIETSIIRTMEKFTGSINELLQHCAELDADKIDAQVEQENLERAVNTLCNEHQLSRQEALDLIESTKTLLITQAIDSLLADGLIKQEFSESGEVLYSCTEDGNKYVNSINQQKTKKHEKSKKLRKR